MSDDDLPPQPQRPSAPGFIWLLIGVVLIVGFILVMRALHPSAIGLGPTHPPAAASGPPKGD